MNARTRQRRDSIHALLLSAPAVLWIVVFFLVPLCFHSRDQFFLDRRVR
jgi:hypothetical protein